MSLAMRKRGRGVGGPAGAPLKRGKPCAPFWAEDRLASVWCFCSANNFSSRAHRFFRLNFSD